VTQQPAVAPVPNAERPIDLSRALAPVIDTPGRAAKPAAHPVLVLGCSAWRSFVVEGLMTLEYEEIYAI
jgi:hypothetical protein